MKKIFQVVAEGEDPREMVEYLTKKAFKDIPSSMKVTVTEVDKKRRYTKEDEMSFCVRVETRISKDSSSEFIAGFNTMFAYWTKVREDGNWLRFSPSGTHLSCMESHLTCLKSFIARMEGLGYKGILEVRLDPFVPSFTSNKNLKKDDLYDMMLDKHLVLLEWTNINNWKDYTYDE